MDDQLKPVTPEDAVSVLPLVKVDPPKPMKSASIFDLAAFPKDAEGTTRSFTPKQVADVLDEYAYAKDRLDKILDRLKVPGEMFYKLTNQYPEIMQRYERAQDLHIARWADDVQEIVDDDSGDVMETVRGPQSNMAAVRRDELRFKARFMLLERRSQRFSPKSSTRNENFNVNANIEVPFDELKNMSLGDLLGAKK